MDLGAFMDLRNKRMVLRHSIYFSMSKRQQKMFNEKFSVVMMEEMSLNDLVKITKSSKIKALYLELLKTYSLKLVS